MTKEDIKPKDIEVKLWECPYCSFLITDISYKYERYDYGCRRCNTPHSKFRSITFKKVIK